MKPEEQRIAIAHACGWKPPTCPEVDALQIGWTTRGQHWLCPKGVLRPAHHMPDYFNDLNAIHEAEKTLDTGLLAKYTTELQRACGGPMSVHFATAPQRCKALLRTIGFWEE